MNIFYLISILILLIIFVKIKKNNKKESIVKWIAIFTVVLFCYNILICFVLNLFLISITLLILTIINVLFSTILFFKYLYKKELQKYEMKFSEIKFLIIYTVIFVTLVMFIHKGEFLIRYDTSPDPSIQYRAAIEFYENKKLLNNVETSQLKTLRPAAYVNIGILFKTVDEFIEKNDFYKVFIIFNIILLYLSGLLFYYTLNKFAKKENDKIIFGIISILYMLGYPLSTYLYGFVYLDMSILMINVLIIYIQTLKITKLKVVNMLVIFLLNLGIFFAQYILAPITYIGLFLYVIIKNLKNRQKLFSKYNICLVLITLVLPGILGIFHNVIPILININNKGKNAIELLSTNGGIYSNLYSNFIYFIPINLIYVYKRIKEKKYDFILITYFLTLIYIIIFFILGILDILSAYYYFKLYYVLWLVALLITFKALLSMMKNSKKFVYIYFFTYFILVANAIAGIDEKITLINEDFNPSNTYSIADVFEKNVKSSMAFKNEIFSEKEVELMNYINDQKLNDKKILYVGRADFNYWFFALTNNTEFTTIQSFLVRPNLEEYKDYEYIAFFYKFFNYKSYEKEKIILKEIMKNEEIVFENNVGRILKVKK